MSFDPPGECPVCGEWVGEGEASCPSCGSCSRTGWNEDAAYDGLDLPGEEDYRPGTPENQRGVWKLLAAAILLALVIWVFVTR